MECRATLYWEDEAGESYQTDVPAFLPGLNEVLQQYTLYGYEDQTPKIRSNVFIVAEIHANISLLSSTYVKLIEKTSYEEAIRIYPNLIEHKK